MHAGVVVNVFGFSLAFLQQRLIWLLETRRAFKRCSFVLSTHRCCGFVGGDGEGHEHGGALGSFDVQYRNFFLHVVVAWKMVGGR